MHGYEIIQELESRTGGVWRPSPGSVYPTLQMLEEEGLIRSEETGGKRLFQLTETGLTEAEAGAAAPAGGGGRRGEGGGAADGGAAAGGMAADDGEAADEVQAAADGEAAAAEADVHVGAAVALDAQAVGGLQGKVAGDLGDEVAALDVDGEALAGDGADVMGGDAGGHADDLLVASGKSLIRFERDNL